MSPQLQRVGNGQSPIIVIDNFSGDFEQVGGLADALAPFPRIEGNYYPGVRRTITQSDKSAYAYVLGACNKAAPFVGSVFGVKGFDLVEASFSIVTLRPEDLDPLQRTPHFDSPEQNIFALLHYLRVPKGSGTAFYRHRSTGIERVTSGNLPFFVSRARAEASMLPIDSGYMHGSDAFYEEIGRVEAVPDRVVIYHSSLLHSGIVPPGMPLSADPREGRLTANFFLRGR